MEKISVIVPYYNFDVYLLRKCLLSLMAQTYDNAEVLVVVDGGDKNIERVKEYFSGGGVAGKNIRFERIEHGGVSKARNYGIEHTGGEYISFVDSDDFVEEVFLEKLYKKIKHADISICGVTERDFPTIDACIDTKIFFSLPAMYNLDQYTNFSVNKLYKRDVIEKYNISFPANVGLGEDALFLADYYERINHISVCSNPLYHYVTNPISATRIYQPQYWEWEKKVIHRQWELFHKYPLAERECDYMYARLYFKYKGLFDYYHNLGDKSCGKYIQDIIKDSLFNELTKHSHKPSEFWTKEMIRNVKKWRRK